MQRGNQSAIFVLFLLSGATGLVYEVVWLRLLVLIFGSTQFATSAILACFMAGLALGAWLGGRWSGCWRQRPLVAYGLIEIGIGLYALAVPALFDLLGPLHRAVWEAGGSGSFLMLSLAKLAGISAVLLPPTMLMGASLPILAREIADDPERIGGKVGGLYAVNIVGAVGGVLLAGFLLLPELGVQTTIRSAAALNLALGLAALLLSRSAGSVDRRPAPRGSAASATAFPWRSRAVLLVAAASGFGALVLEVAWTRVLVLVLGSSVYAFSVMLLAFLTGLAAGGACFSALLRRRPTIDPALLLAVLLSTAGLLTWAGAFCFRLLPRLFTWAFFQWEPSTGGWFGVQLLLSLLVMFPATFALGGVFPAVLQLHARGLDRVARSEGTVYGSNTLGCIARAVRAGFVLIPGLGVMRTVWGTACLQALLALAVIFTLTRATANRTRLAAAAALTLTVIFVARPAWDVMAMNSGVFINLHGMPSGSTWKDVLEGYEDVVPLYAAEGAVASVFVADEPEHDNRFLAINGKVDASSRTDLATQLLLAHVPLLLHESPRDVMIVGLASGITAGAAATHPVERIRVVELEEKMVPAARFFSEHNNRVLDDWRARAEVVRRREATRFHRPHHPQTASHTGLR